MTDTTVGVDRETRDALGVVKYQTGSDSFDETIRNLLAEADMDGALEG